MNNVEFTDVKRTTKQALYIINNATSCTKFITLNDCYDTHSCDKQIAYNFWKEFTTKYGCSNFHIASYNCMYFSVAFYDNDFYYLITRDHNYRTPRYTEKNTLYESVYLIHSLKRKNGYFNFYLNMSTKDIYCKYYVHGSCFNIIIFYDHNDNDYVCQKIGYLNHISDSLCDLLYKTYLRLCKYYTEELKK